MPMDKQSFEDLPLSVLEQRLVEIDEELSRLPSYSLRTGVGTKGHRSSGHSDPNRSEWVQIDLVTTETVDQIALVPTILRDTKKGLIGEAFPEEFKVFAGLNGDDKGSIIASSETEDQTLPRIAPLVRSFPPIKADWVRIEATKLSPRGFEGKFFLQLSEILIFSGAENVALRKPVEASSQMTSDDSIFGNSWRKEFAVDGFVPYLMDAEEGKQSLAFVSIADGHTTFSADLGESYPLDRVHFHTVEQNATIPAATVGDYGLPKRFILQGANREDFSDATTLIDFTRTPTRDTGPMLLLPFAKTYCRYVRLIAEPATVPIDEKDREISAIGFSEIEIFAQGRNVLLGKRIVTDLVSNDPLRSSSTLTDGLNFYGKILPFRDWINELARRHDLEFERPLLVAELNERYARQKANLNRTYWLIALLAGVIIAIVLIDRIIRLRQIASIKERLAADLHDELGADLHTIGLLSDLAEESKDSPEELTMLHKRIRNVTMQSGKAVRHCTDMLEAAGSKVSIKDNIHQASRRIMAKLENSISIEGEEYLDKLKSKTRFDLCLFYNECLVNISRHSGASKFITQLKADKDNVLLVVSDNGRGLSSSDAKSVPESLKRRARLLGAKVFVETPEMGGTRINLKLKTRKWGIRK